MIETPKFHRGHFFYNCVLRKRESSIVTNTFGVQNDKFPTFLQFWHVHRRSMTFNGDDINDDEEKCKFNRRFHFTSSSSEEEEWWVKRIKEISPSSSNIQRVSSRDLQNFGHFYELEKSFKIFAKFKNYKLYWKFCPFALENIHKIGDRRPHISRGVCLSSSCLCVELWFIKVNSFSCLFLSFSISPFWCAGFPCNLLLNVRFIIRGSPLLSGLRMLNTKYN